MNKNYSSKLPETYKFPLYLFYQGKNCEAYKFFGVHEVEKDNKKYHCFRVWAPNAVSISVVGDFNDWNKSSAPMKQISDGVWECFLPALEQFSSYKYCIETKKGEFFKDLESKFNGI